MFPLTAHFTHVGTARTPNHSCLRFHGYSLWRIGNST